MFAVVLFLIHILAHRENLVRGNRLQPPHDHPEEILDGFLANENWLKYSRSNPVAVPRDYNDSAARGKASWPWCFPTPTRLVGRRARESRPEVFLLCVVLPYPSVFGPPGLPQYSRSKKQRLPSSDTWST